MAENRIEIVNERSQLAVVLLILTNSIFDSVHVRSPGVQLSSGSLAIALKIERAEME